MRSETEGRMAAEEFRHKNHLGTQPLGDLVSLIEQSTGIDVAIVEADVDEHGLSMRDPIRSAVFIAVAQTTRPMRQRSTLAHELAHVIFRDWAVVNAPVPTDRTPEERRADAFARHLLIPIEGLKEVLGVTAAVDLAVLSSVVQRFLVSPAIAAIALNEAGYIDAETKTMWLTYVQTPTLASRYGWSDQYRTLQSDSQMPRAPQRLVARAIDGYLQNVVSAQTLGTLHGRDAASVEADLKQAGLVPAVLEAPWAKAADLPVVELDLSELDDDAVSDSD